MRLTTSRAIWRRVEGSREHIRHVLTATWYVITPLFAVLVGRTIYERACLGLAEPWPWLVGRPFLSLTVGAVFVAAHWWCLLWLLVSDAALRWFRGEPPATHGVGGRSVMQFATVLLLLAIEYSPLTPWRWMMRTMGC